jgi:MFS family permease
MTHVSSVVSVPSGNAGLLRLSIGTFLAYLTVALPLPVLPLHVRHTLGYSDFIVGLVIGVQFAAALLTRGYAGRLADTAGPHRAMRYGTLLSAMAGLVYLVSSLLPSAGLQLVVLIFGRLLLGTGESLLVTGMLAWGIGTVGPGRSGKVMSWTGMAIFGALAAGSPIGLAIDSYSGFTGVSLATMALPLLGFCMTLGVAPVAAMGGHRLPLRTVLARITPPALGLALQGVGFAAIGAFITLYFSANGWSGAGWSLTCFGTAFVLVRLLFGHLPDRIGGKRVAMVSLVVELLGLILLWLAVAPWMGFVGVTLVGAGSSLMFPALGVEVVRRVPGQVRATALGGYAAFLDAAYAFTGPIAGLLAAHFNYAAVFLFAAIAASLGLVVVSNLKPTAAV